jgi:hypothetical protein
MFITDDSDIWPDFEPWVDYMIHDRSGRFVAGSEKIDSPESIHYNYWKIKYDYDGGLKAPDSSGVFVIPIFDDEELQ